VGSIDGAHIHQLSDLERRLEGFRVEFVGRLVVLLDETGRVVGEVFELALDHALLDGGVVEFAQFAPGGMEVAREPSRRRLGLADVGRTLAEQLRRRIELLVDLQPGDESEGLVIVLGHWRPLGGGGG